MQTKQMRKKKPQKSMTKRLHANRLDPALWIFALVRADVSCPPEPTRQGGGACQKVQDHGLLTKGVQREERAQLVGTSGEAAR